MIIETTGRTEKSSKKAQTTVWVKSSDGRRLKIDQSLSHNGVCHVDKLADGCIG